MENMTNDFRLVVHDSDLPVPGVVAQRNHTSDPQPLAFGGADLVADALGGDLRSNWAKDEQDVERQPDPSRSWC